MWKLAYRALFSAGPPTSGGGRCGRRGCTLRARLSRLSIKYSRVVVLAAPTPVTKPQRPIPWAVDGQMDRWTDGQMDRWTDAQGLLRLRHRPLPWCNGPDPSALLLHFRIGGNAEGSGADDGPTIKLKCGALRGWLKSAAAFSVRGRGWLLRLVGCCVSLGCRVVCLQLVLPTQQQQPQRASPLPSSASRSIHDRRRQEYPGRHCHCGSGDL